MKKKNTGAVHLGKLSAKARSKKLGKKGFHKSMSKLARKRWRSRRKPLTFARCAVCHSVYGSVQALTVPTGMEIARKYILGITINGGEIAFFCDSCYSAHPNE